MRSAVIATLVGTALSLGGIQGTMAADIPVKAPVSRAPAPVVAASWTGCYIGGHVGGSWGRTRWSNPAGDTATFRRNQDDDYSDVIGGGLLGCNYQVSNWIVGIEGDFSWLGVNSYVLDDVVNRDEIFRTKIDWVGTVRGRLGFLVVPRWLVYATGGWAFTRIKAGYENYTDSTLSTLTSSEIGTISDGWVAGGGVEYAFTDNWLGRVEYLYYDFGDDVVSPTIISAGPESAHVTLHTARVALSYKFSWPR